jgi:hypothetical protein
MKTRLIRSKFINLFRVAREKIGNNNAARKDEKKEDGLYTKKEKRWKEEMTYMIESRARPAD